MLDQKYFPLFQEPKVVEFISLTQEKRMVAGYEAEFTKLSRYDIYLINDENRVARKFEMGLKLRSRHKMMPF